MATRYPTGFGPASARPVVSTAVPQSRPQNNAPIYLRRLGGAR